MNTFKCLQAMNTILAWSKQSEAFGLGSICGLHLVKYRLASLLHISCCWTTDVVEDDVDGFKK